MWYGGGATQIEWSTGKAILGGNQDLVDDLLNIIWKATTKVAFGIKDKYVVAWYCDVKPLSALTVIPVKEITSSPLFQPGSGSRRRLNSFEHRRLAVRTNVASNAMDDDKDTFMVTVKGYGMNWVGKLKNKNMQVSSVRITNA